MKDCEGKMYKKAEHKSNVLVGLQTPECVKCHTTNWKEAGKHDPSSSYHVGNLCPCAGSRILVASESSSDEIQHTWARRVPSTEQRRFPTYIKKKQGTNRSTDLEKWLFHDHILQKEERTWYTAVLFCNLLCSTRTLHHCLMNILNLVSDTITS